MLPTLNDLWGSIFLSLISILLLISILISIFFQLPISESIFPSAEFKELVISVTYPIRKPTGFILPSTGLDNVEIIIDSQFFVLILIILILFLFSLFLIRDSSFRWKESDRRLKFSLLLGYIKDADYGYEELHQRFIKLTKNISEEDRKNFLTMSGQKNTKKDWKKDSGQKLVDYIGSRRKKSRISLRN